MIWETEELGSNCLEKFVPPKIFMFRLSSEILLFSKLHLARCGSTLSLCSLPMVLLIPRLPSFPSPEPIIVVVGLGLGRGEVAML